MAANTSAKQRQCLVRAMFFESNRSSDAGLLAVGSVVMNRVASPKFPDTICGVVGQPNQFAPGVLSRKMNPRTVPRAERIADQVLAGKRHKKVGPAMFFHTAGLHFPYHNMHYMVVAGGNAFYEKTNRYNRTPAPFAVATTDVPLPASRPKAAALPGVAAAFDEPRTQVDVRVAQAFAPLTN